MSDQPRKIPRRQSSTAAERVPVTATAGGAKRDEEVREREDGSTTRLVSAAPALGTLYDRTDYSNAAVYRSHVEFIANSLRALRASESKEKSIKIIYVYSDTSKRLQEIIFMDNGCGMDGEALNGWSILANRDESRVLDSSRALTSSEENEELKKPIGSHADAQLHFFGRGSKHAGFNVGTSIFCITTKSDTDQIFCMRLDKENALANSRAGRNWSDAEIISYPKSKRSKILHHVSKQEDQSQRAKGDNFNSTLEAVVKSEFIDAAPEHFTCFIVSKLYQDVINQMDLETEAFVTAAELTSRYFVPYLVDDLNCLDFVPKIEVSAVLLDIDSADTNVQILRSWRIDLGLGVHAAGDGEKKLRQIDPLGKHHDPFPVRLDPLRALIGKLEDMEASEAKSPVKTHFDFSFRIFEKKNSKSRSGTIHCRIFLLPRRNGQNLLAWCSSEEKHRPIRDIWSSKPGCTQHRFQCYWKGQCLYNFSVDNLWFLQALEHQKKVRYHIVGILQFGAVDFTDPTKQAFGEEIANMLVDPAKTIARLDNPYHVAYNFPNNKATASPRIGPKFDEWYRNAMQKYDQTVQITWKDPLKRTQIESVRLNGQIMSVDTYVHFNHDYQFPLSLGDNEAKMKKVLGVITALKLPEGQQVSENDTLSDVFASIQRVPHHLFDQSPFVKSVFSLNANTQENDKLLNAIKTRAPASLRIELEYPSSSTPNSKVSGSLAKSLSRTVITKSQKKQTINWKIGGNNPSIRLHILDGNKSRSKSITGWYRKIYAKSPTTAQQTTQDNNQRLNTLLDHRHASSKTYDRVPWRNSMRFKKGTVVATTTGCTEVGPSRTFYEYPSEWIEDYVLKGEVGEYELQFGVEDWSHMNDETPVKDSHILSALYLYIKCEAGDPFDIFDYKFEDPALPNKAIRNAQAGDTIRLTFLLVDTKNHRISDDVLGGSLKVLVQSLSPDFKGTSKEPKWNKARKLYQFNMKVSEKATHGDVTVSLRLCGCERDPKEHAIVLNVAPPRPDRLEVIPSAPPEENCSLQMESPIFVENHASLKGVLLGLFDKHNKPAAPPEDKWFVRVTSTRTVRLDGESRLDLTPDMTQIPLEGIFAHLDPISANQSKSRNRKGARKKQVTREKREMIFAQDAYDAVFRVTCYDSDNKAPFDSPCEVSIMLLPSTKPHFLRVFKKMDDDTMLDDADLDEKVWIDGNVTFGSVEIDSKMYAREFSEVAGSKISNLVVKQYDEAGRPIGFASDRVLLLSMEHLVDDAVIEKNEDIEFNVCESFEIEIPQSGKLRISFQIVNKSNDDYDSDSEEPDPYLRPLNALIKAEPGAAASFQLEPGPETYRCGTKLSAHGVTVMAHDKFGNMITKEDKSIKLFLHLCPYTDDDDADAKEGLHLGPDIACDDAGAEDGIHFYDYAVGEDVELFWDRNRNFYTTEESIVGPVDTRVGIFLIARHRADDASIIETATRKNDLGISTSLNLAVGPTHTLKLMDGISLDHCGKYQNVIVRALDKAGNSTVVIEKEKKSTTTLTLELYSKSDGKLIQLSDAPTATVGDRDSECRAIVAENCGDHFKFGAFWIWAEDGEEVKLRFVLHTRTEKSTHNIKKIVVSDTSTRPASISLNPSVQEILAGVPLQPFRLEVFDKSGNLFFYSKSTFKKDVKNNVTSDEILDNNQIDDIQRTSGTLNLGALSREITLRPSKLKVDYHAEDCSFSVKQKGAAKDDPTITCAGEYTLEVSLSQSKLNNLFRDYLPKNTFNTLKVSATIRVVAGPPIRLAVMSEKDQVPVEQLNLGPLNWKDIDFVSCSRQPYRLCADLWLRAYDKYNNICEAWRDLSGLKLEWPNQKLIELFYDRKNSSITTSSAFSARAGGTTLLSGGLSTRSKLEARDGYVDPPEPGRFRYELLIRGARGVLQKDRFDGTREFKLKFSANECTSACVNIIVVDLSSKETELIFWKNEEHEKRQQLAALEQLQGEAQYRLEYCKEENLKLLNEMNEVLKQMPRNLQSQALVRSDLQARVLDRSFVRDIERIQEDMIRFHSSHTGRRARDAPWQLTVYTDTRIIGKVCEIFVIKDDDHARLLAWHIGSERMNLLITSDEQSASAHANGRQLTKPITSYYAASSVKAPHKNIRDLSLRDRAGDIWNKSRAILAIDCVETIFLPRKYMENVLSGTFGGIILFQASMRTITDYRACFPPGFRFTFTCISIYGGERISSDGTRGGSGGKYVSDDRRPAFHAVPPITQSEDYKHLAHILQIVTERKPYDKYKHIEEAQAGLNSIIIELKKAREAYDYANAQKLNLQRAVKFTRPPPTSHEEIEEEPRSKRARM